MSSVPIRNWLRYTTWTHMLIVIFLAFHRKISQSRLWSWPSCLIIIARLLKSSNSCWFAVVWGRIIRNRWQSSSIFVDKIIIQQLLFDERIYLRATLSAATLAASAINMQEAMKVLIEQRLGSTDGKESHPIIKAHRSGITDAQ